MTVRAARAGFLLAETLTTFTISAFILAGLVTLSSVLLRSADASVARMQQTEEVARVLEALHADIGSALRARWAGTEPQDFLFNGDRHRLMFARLETGPDRRPVTRVVALKSDDGDKRLLRADAILRATASHSADLRFGSPREFYKGTIGIRFAFVPDETAGEPQRQVLVWPTGPTMPSAVIVEAVELATNAVLITMRVPIIANADPGCLDDGFCARADVPPRADADRPAAAQAAPPTAKAL